jgi:putative DNA primase/helicase
MKPSTGKPRSNKIDYDAINTFALSRFEALLRQRLPDGKKSGAEYVARNPTRSDGHAGSFSINVNTGVWEDFATGDRGGDPISLFAYLFHNNNQGDAAKALAEQFGLSERLPAGSSRVTPVIKPKAKVSPWQPIIPPADAPKPPKAHSKRGLPEHIWCYRGTLCNILGFVYRFKTSDGGKEVLPLSWCRHELTGLEEWRWMAFAQPRWLYGLDRLGTKPDAPVLIVEGEKCADAAAAQLPHLACVTWPGGGKAVDKIDLTPLAGRDVIIWPDCDAQRDKAGVLLPQEKQPGWMAAQRIAYILTNMLPRHGGKLWVMTIPPPGEKKSGWDIVDAIAEGLTGEALLQYIREHSKIMAEAHLGGGADKNSAEPPPADAGYLLGIHREEWELGLIEKNRGGYEDCRENVFLILSRHPEWRGVIGWNSFTRRVEKTRPTPFGSPAGEWKTADDYETGLWIAQHCNLLIHSEAVLMAGIAMCADKNPFNPPKDWLESLPPWDGVNRLEYFIADCVMCDNSRYVQLVGKFFMIGAVARLLKPGCPMQYMPILEGKQGTGKSSLWRVLGGPWFQDTPIKLGDKDAYMQLTGVLIYEIAEMDSFNRAETTQVKSFITQENDRFREPYGRRVMDFPRQCVFGGTTNQGEYLKDTTGNRRMWPIQTFNIRLDLLKELRDSLFAEALHRFNAGERWHPTRDEEREHFIPEQDARRIVDPWLYPIQEWLDIQHPKDEFTVTEILMGAIKVELNRIDNNNGMSMRIGRLMAELGWKRKRNGTRIDRVWVYKRPT